jgi:putative SbcD/Mre11-related phosphoesterase
VNGWGNLYATKHLLSLERLLIFILFTRKMKKYEFIGKSAYFPELKLLAIADLHLGYEEAMNGAGIMLPRSQFNETIEDLDKIFSEIKKEKKKVEEVVIVGDLKHEFSGLLNQEWGEVLELIELLKKKAHKVIIVKGNHDNYVANIIKDKAKISNFYIKDVVCFVHGDKPHLECLDKKIKLIIMGHKHPAVTLREGEKSERYKCFLVGEWKGKRVIILPSFFPLVEGSDVFIEDTNLAFKLNLSKFEVYVVGDKVYEFGKMRGI